MYTWVEWRITRQFYSGTLITLTCLLNYIMNDVYACNTVLLRIYNMFILRMDKHVTSISMLDRCFKFIVYILVHMATVYHLMSNLVQ